MKSYFSATYPKAILQSFYKPEIYRDAIVKWQGFGGKYIALLSLLLALVLAVNLVVAIFEFQKTELPYLVEQLPEMSLDKGILTVKGPQPVLVKTRDKELTIKIDTTQSEKQMRQEKYKIGIGRDFVFFTDYQGNDKSFDLKDIKDNFKITHRQLYRLWDNTVPKVQIAAIPLLWAGQAMDLLLECMVVAVLSYMVTAFMPEEYNFVTRMRLAVLAVTPGEILIAFLKVTFQHQAQPWLIFLIACLYIYVMIILIRKLPPVATV